MVTEDLMRKYKYGYVHSCKLLEEPFIKDLLKVNQELKKQLENCYCERTDCGGRLKDSKVYDSLVQKVETQQQEFIKYLEDMLDDKNDMFSVVRVIDALQKYKEIVGVSDDN